MRKWEYHQEVIPPTPNDIGTVCEAAGKDGWELAGMLAVMLPPSAKKQQTQRRASGLLLTETVADEKINPALAAQLEAADNQPVKAVMLMFKRPAGEDS